MSEGNGNGGKCPVTGHGETGREHAKAELKAHSNHNWWPEQLNLKMPLLRVYN